MKTIGFLVVGGALAASGLGYHHPISDFLMCTVGGFVVGIAIARAVMGEWN